MQADDDRHRQAVIDIWANNFSNCNASPERYQWLYGGNPYGAAKTWMLVTGTDEIVGVSSLFPRKLWIQNKSVLTWSAVDLAVNREHRFLGPALSLQRAVVSTHLSAQTEFIFGHPNKAACGMIKRAKYKAIGTETCWSKPLQIRDRIKEKINNAFLSSVFGLLYTVFLELQYWKERAFFQQKFYTKIISTCGEEFDILWSEVRSEYGITPEKDSCYLNWRFGEHQDRNIKIYCLFDSRDKLLGYIAYSVRNRAVTVEDFCVQNLSCNFPMLVSSFSRTMRKMGYTAILLSYLGNKFFQKSLKRLFFFKRDSGSTSFVYFHPDCSSEYQKYVLNADNWFLVGDFDI